jgi:hypothetical protein
MITDEFIVRYNAQPPDRARSKKSLWFDIINAAVIGKWFTILPVKSKGYLSTEVSIWNSNEVWGKGVFVSLRWQYDHEADYFMVSGIKKKQEQAK